MAWGRSLGLRVWSLGYLSLHYKSPKHALKLKDLGIYGMAWKGVGIRVEHLGLLATMGDDKGHITMR